MKLKRQCPICMGEQGEKLLDIAFENLPNNNLPIEYDIVCCKKCGFAFADMEASQNLYDEYYRACNMYSEAEVIRNDIFGENEMYKKLISLLRNNNIDVEAPILDIGCGGGGLIWALSKAGYNNVYGMDPSAKSVENIKKRNNEAFIGNIFDDVASENLHKFHVVISTMVLEHIYDLNKYIEQLKLYAKLDNAYIIINVPTVDGFPEFVTPIPNYFNQEHINYFGEISLENLLRKHQLKIVNEDKYLVEKGEKELLVLCRFAEKEEKEDILKDTKSQQNIRKYIKLAKRQEELISQIISDIVKNKNKIVIWGTGSYTMQLLKKYPDIKENILFFVDNNNIKQGNLLAGKEICPCDRLINVPDNIEVVVSCIKGKEGIKRQICEMELKNKIVFL